MAISRRPQLRPLLVSAFAANTQQPLTWTSPCLRCRIATGQRYLAQPSAPRGSGKAIAASTIRALFGGSHQRQRRWRDKTREREEGMPFRLMEG
jgi:hypothetical protein